MKTKRRLRRGWVLLIWLLCIALIWMGIFWFNSGRLPWQEMIDAEMSMDFADFGLSPDDFFMTIGSPENHAELNDVVSFTNNMLHLRAMPNISRDTFESLAQEHNAQITSFMRWDTMGHSITFTFNRIFTYSELEELARYFESMPIVQYANLDIVFQMDMEFSLPFTYSPPTNSRWGLDAIDINGAWIYESLMSDVAVLVLDTGFYRNHENLILWSGPGSRSVGLYDPAHGTHVSGIIGGTPNNTRNTSGVAPNARIYGVNLLFFNDDNERDGMSLHNMLELMAFYVREMDARVINYSMGFNRIEFAASRWNENAVLWVDYQADLFERYFRKLIDDNQQFVFVTSSGNQFESNPSLTNLRYSRCPDPCTNEDCNEVCFGFISSPNGNYAGIASAAFSPTSRILDNEVRGRIITVGAVDEQGNMANFSQRAAGVDVFAPGVNIYSTNNVTTSWLGNNTSHYRLSQGTSQAAPHVAGIATMMFGIYPDISGERVKEIIVRTANPDQNNLVNAAEAVQIALLDSGQVSLVPPPAPSPPSTNTGWGWLDSILDDFLNNLDWLAWLDNLLAWAISLFDGGGPFSWVQETISEEMLVGRWRLIRMEASIPDTFLAPSDFSGFVEEFSNAYLEIFADGTTVMVDGNAMDSGSWELHNGRITLNIIGEWFGMTFDINLTNNGMILTNNTLGMVTTLIFERAGGAMGSGATPTAPTTPADPDGLLGMWRLWGTEYYIFNADGTGSMMDLPIRWWSHEAGVLSVCVKPSLCGTWPCAVPDD